MKTKIRLFIAVLSITFWTGAQTLDRVEPPFWWVGMNNPDVQLMVYGEEINTLSPEMSYQGVKIKSVTVPENPNYLFIDLEISPEAQPGSFNILFKQGSNTKIKHAYQIRERTSQVSNRESFDASDVLYLITPDRFVNGNPENDNAQGMLEKVNRQNKGGRHGGDIAGIRQSLDYISELGFTAIWMNPVLENNMEAYSYHGYSTTDFYKVDPRFGSNEEYVELVQEAESKGIKVIMDMIVNHCGSNHWWMNDLPASDWVNFQDAYENGNYVITNHRKSTIQDPYGSKVDLKRFTDGWFVRTMPDMNQQNPYVATYLIQNSIWWIEYAGIHGIRMDTYPYPDKEFMADWTCRVKEEFPYFNTVGEEWNLDQAIVAYWQEGKKNPDGYTSCLPSLMDFPLQNKLVEALNDPEENYDGLVDLYMALSRDFQYADPMNLVVFPDNHDMSRIYTQLNEDFDLFKLGLAYLLTVRGIPQIYYGTEILMKNPGTTDHGIIRSDFPGGWKGDDVDAFTGKGLTSKQKEATKYLKTILNWRKSKRVIHYGDLMHYVPENGMYVMFRYNETDKVMTVLSKNEKTTTLELDRFSEMITGTESGTEIISGKAVQLDGTLKVPAMTPMIIDFD